MDWYRSAPLSPPARDWLQIYFPAEAVSWLRPLLRHSQSARTDQLSWVRLGPRRNGLNSITSLQISCCAARVPAASGRQPLRRRLHLPCQEEASVNFLLLGSGALLATIVISPPNAARAEDASHNPAAEKGSAEFHGEVIHSIEFTGLRRIRPAALKAYIHSLAGERCNGVELEKDVRRLDGLGWFEFVRVEILPTGNNAANLRPGGELPSNRPDHKGVKLVFALEERPFLSEVKFRGSHVFSRT